MCLVHLVMKKDRFGFKRLNNVWSESVQNLMSIKEQNWNGGSVCMNRSFFFRKNSQNLLASWLVCRLRLWEEINMIHFIQHKVHNQLLWCWTNPGQIHWIPVYDSYNTVYHLLIYSHVFGLHLFNSWKKRLFLTYEVPGHLLILLYAADIRELQQGIDVVRVHL